MIGILRAIPLTCQPDIVTDEIKVTIHKSSDPIRIIWTTFFSLFPTSLQRGFDIQNKHLSLTIVPADT